VSEADVEAIVQRALEARKRGDWKATIEVFESGRAQHPDSVRLLTLLGTAYRLRYRYADAIEVLRRAEELAPDDYDVLVELGHSLRLDGDAWAAMAAHGRLRERYPERAEARFAEAMTRTALGRPETVGDVVERLLAESPGDLRFQLGRARLLIRMGQLTAALEMLRAVLVSHPQHVDGWLMRAEAAAGLLRSDEEIEAARRAFELLPDAPLTLYWMHFVALLDGDAQKAHDYLQRALAVHASCLPARLALGGLYWMADRLDLAERELAAANEIGASWHGTAVGTYARFQLATGRGQPDLMLLEGQAQTMPYGGMPYQIGQIYLEHVGDAARAARFFRIACDCAPDAPETHERCGNALISAGQLDEAAVKLRRAVELCPALGSAWESLGVALRRQRDLAGSAAAYAEAIQRLPRSPTARRGYGATMLELGDSAAAIAQLEIATEIDPESSGGHFLLACALEQSNRSEDALAAALRARARKPDDRDAAALVERLQRGR
jgi:tetratricopeptide (TPR) repeat protein